jgi:hypothetical protein
LRNELKVLRVSDLWIKKCEPTFAGLPNLCFLNSGPNPLGSISSVNDDNVHCTSRGLIYVYNERYLTCLLKKRCTVATIGVDFFSISLYYMLCLLFSLQIPLQPAHIYTQRASTLANFTLTGFNFHKEKERERALGCTTRPEEAPSGTERSGGRGRYTKCS